MCCKYRIAGNFRGKKLRKQGVWRFRRENFSGFILYTGYGLRAHAMFAKKTFTNGLRSAKFSKVFSLESFPLYGNMRCTKLMIPSHHRAASEFCKLSGLLCSYGLYQVVISEQLCLYCRGNMASFSARIVLVDQETGTSRFRDSWKFERLIFITNPKPKGIPSSASQAPPSLENPIQKA